MGGFIYTAMDKIPLNFVLNELYFVSYCLRKFLVIILEMDIITIVSYVGYITTTDKCDQTLKSDWHTTDYL